MKAFIGLRVLALGTSIAAIVAASNPASAATSDFFCIPLSDKTHGVFFETQVRDCGTGKADVKKGVCQEEVQCAFVEPSLQHTMEAEYTKRNPKAGSIPFNSIPLADKTLLLKNSMGLAFHPSVVTCNASAAAALGRVECPAPDQCKDDAAIDSTPITISAAGTTTRRDPSVIQEPVSNSGSALPANHHDDRNDIF